MNWYNAMGYVRFIILPDNEDWQKILLNSYTGEKFSIQIKQNKKLLESFVTCTQKLMSTIAHHIFYKSETAGTILMDNSTIGLEKFCINYSLISKEPVIILNGHPECFDLYDLEIYKNGSLVRKSNYIGKKLYNDADEILKPMYAAFLNNEIGQQTTFENLPHLLPLLYNFGWTEELLNQKKWQMITTNLN